MSKPPICRRLGDHRQRRAVSGILAAVILFAMLFVAGMGYLVYINQASQAVVQANAARQGAELISGKESLTTTVTLSGGAPPNYLVVSASNTGGTSSVISYIYVTDLSGKLVSNFMGPAPQAGTNATALWPISLSAGQSTGLLKGCVSGKTGCNIELTGYTYSGSPVMVEVVTKSGNTFGAQYPPASSQLNQPNPLVVSMVATPPQVFSCDAPNCITLTVTVYNYAPSPVTNVQLDPSPPTALVTGTAGVGVFGGSCSAPSPSSTIPAYTSGNPSSITFTCTYSSTTGPVGGFASFSGGALGTLGAGAAASAQAISNTIQIGGNSNVPTQGAFAANYFFLEYSACQNGPSGSVGSYSYSSPCSTAPATMPPANLNALADGNYISGFGDFYVAYYVQVTNVFNTTLPILEYSYLFADPGVSAEAYSFLAGTVATPYFPNYCNNVSNPCASNDLPQLTAYTATPTTCTNNPNQCIEVAPGQTVTLTFAACGYGSSNWVWAGTPYGRYLDNPTGCITSPPGYIQPTTGVVEVPEGQTLSIVLSYLYKNQVYVQSMPFEGQTVTNLRTTSTVLACSPATDPVNSPSSCTVTVTDLSAGTAVTPTGTVTITQEPLTGGTFSNGGSCALSGSGAVATCTITYTPGLGQEQTDYLTASYPGDTIHSGSSSPTIAITAVQRSTSTSVVCTPSASLPNTQTNCVTTVTDTSPGTTVVPTGKVTLSQSPGASGKFTNSSGTYTTAECVLASGTCSVTFTPNSGLTGTVTITTSYGGDTDHATSTGSEPVMWGRYTTTTISCPTPEIIGTGYTCKVTVADTSTGTPVTPTGTVTFSQGSPGTGTFSPSNGQCILAQFSLGTATCTVSFTPGSNEVGSLTMSASYPGDTGHLPSSNNQVITVTKATPLVTTSFNPASPTTGNPVNDVATLSGGFAPTGTVTFYEGFTSNTCTSGGSQVGSPVTISGGSASSSSLTLSTGTYYWDAVYSGDGNNNGVTSPCETLTVKATPTIATLLSAGTIPTGGSVYDTATLSGSSGSNAGGTVNYNYYSGSSCGGTASLVSTVTVSNGNVPNSGSQTFTKGGSYSWNAVYSGDANNQGATSPCETLTVTAKHVAEVQDVAGSSTTSSPFTCSFSSQPAVGDLIVVSFTETPNTLSVSSIKDHASNSLSLVSSATETSSSVKMKAFMYEEIVPSGDTSSSPITITLSGSPTSAVVTCIEFSGVLSGTPVTSATNQGTTTSSTMSIALSSGISPASNDLVYAYTGYSNCGSTSKPTTSSPYTAGAASIASGSPKPGSTTCTTGSTDYRFNQGDQYDASWASGSTTGPFSVSQTAPTSGSSGWVEIVVEFDPPGQSGLTATPSTTASNGSIQGAPLGALAMVLAISRSRDTSLGAGFDRGVRRRQLGFPKRRCDGGILG